jgi:hypothetical protein
MRKEPVLRILSFCIPVLIFIEAHLYWRFQRRNFYSVLTWVQIVLLAVALPTAFGAEAIWRMNIEMARAGDKSVKDLIAEIMILQTIVFSILLIASQIIFLILLVKFRSHPHVPNPSSDPENLLDDLAP